MEERLPKHVRRFRQWRYDSMKSMERKNVHGNSTSLIFRILAALSCVWMLLEIFDVEDREFDLNMPEAILAAGTATLLWLAGELCRGEGRLFRLEDGQRGISFATLRALSVRHGGAIRGGLMVLALLSALWVVDEIYDLERMRFDPDLPEAVLPACMFLVFVWLIFRTRRFESRPTEERSLLEELRRRSETDELTGLYNKSAFNEKVNGYLGEWAKPGECALFMIDMDNFKSVNDTYGHLTGDYVLAETGKALRGAFQGRKAWLGRVGGDEFMIFVYQCRPNDLDELAERLRAALNIPIPESKDIFTGSIGLAVYEEGDNFDSLYVRADKGLYDAKKYGRRSVAETGGTAEAAYSGRIVSSH